NTAGDTTVAVALGTLAGGGGTATITFDVTVDDPVPAGVDEIVCQGLVTQDTHPDASTDDPDEPGGADPTVTPLGAAPDVSATKVDSLLVDGDFDGLVDPGDTVRYTIVVRNDGDQDAAGVTFDSSVDAATALVVGSVTATQGSVTTGNTAGDTAVAVDLGTLAGSGGTATITFDVTVDAPLPAGVTSVACQGQVDRDGGGGPEVTDDPDDPTGDDDPTLTPLDLGEDFGDAPETYTTDASPRHRLDAAAGIYLGTCVDAEASGQAGPDADGDDVNAEGAPTATLGTCSGGDDEDGVVFDTMISACTLAQITVTSSGAGLLDAWIDFDGDGSFAGTGEQIFTGQALTGSDSLGFTAPCSTAAGFTYARFRVSSAGGLSFDGAADNGEVEDYRILAKGLDFGDAPDSYGTTQGAGGAWHTVVPGYGLGAVDTELDGQPTPGADGDDTAGTPDDEDGVGFGPQGAMAVACSTGNPLEVTLTDSAAIGAARLDAWIDFDGDGAFDDPAEHLFGGTPATLAVGTNTLAYDVPCDVSPGNVYARFRLSSAGGLTPTGPAVPAMDGEVEDYTFTVKGLDFGDAPEARGYPTLLASNGARHAVVPTANPTLGAAVDTESDGQPTDACTGDDLAGVDDEDGVTLPGSLLAGGPAQDATLVAGATGGLVSAWVDWNGDGDWLDPGEQVATDLPLADGASAAVSLAAPMDAFAGTVCARFRISTATGLTPTGSAPDGEVEDVAVEILDEDPAIGLGKALLSVEREGPGEHLVTFALTVDNLGNVPLSSVQAVAELADAFAEAEGFDVVAVETSDFTVNPAFDGDADPNLLTGADTLGVDGMGTIILQVLLRPGTNEGPYVCSSVATGESPAGIVVEDISQDGGDSDPDDDGDPTNNGDPTLVVLGIPPVDIPTVGQMGLLLLATLLAAFGLGTLRRRSTGGAV
ncbi:MAG: IPTL-CTERM sorting domain-containing protein, partial [Acidobacteriota bacterium]